MDGLKEDFTRVKLGFKGPQISLLCFGSLAVSPLQGRVTAAEGTEIFRHAVEKGINWVDTAEIYDNYGQLAPVLKQHPHVKVVSKSYAVTAKEMSQSLEKARQALQRDTLDFFLLHEQESALTLKGHREAWEELLKAKERGIVRWAGISTHAVAGVRAGALLPGIDVIHAIVNMEGIGIIDGSLQDMLKAIAFAAELRIGIYAMKVFGGGHLASRPEEAIDFVRHIPGVQAMALGMSSKAEVDYNVMLVNGEKIPQDIREKVLYRERRLFIAEWCQGCGRCVQSCPQGALSLVDGRAKVDEQRCVLCGYCGRVCPHFCLKLV